MKHKAALKLYIEKMELQVEELQRTLDKIKEEFNNLSEDRKDEVPELYKNQPEPPCKPPIITGEVSPKEEEDEYLEELFKEEAKVTKKPSWEDIWSDSEGDDITFVPKTTKQEVQEIQETKEPEEPKGQEKKEEKEEKEELKTRRVEPVSSDPVEVHKPGRNLKDSISLIDYFYFKKELFADSDAFIQDELKFLSNLDNYDAAAEHLIAKHKDWDLDDDAVKRFLETIRIYYDF